MIAVFLGIVGWPILAAAAFLGGALQDLPNTQSPVAAARTRPCATAGSSAIIGYTIPAIAAPTIGATQNSHNCSSAHPPTNTAGPVLRAGFTLKFVTGI